MKTRPAAAISTVLLLAGVAHFDWHLGRPGHAHLSFGWPWHWVVGLVAFGIFGWVRGRREDPHSWRGALALSGAALFVAQVIEPLGEMVAFHLPWTAVMPLVRWRVFAEFVLSAASAGTGLFLVARRTRRRRVDAMERSQGASSY